MSEPIIVQPTEEHRRIARNLVTPGVVKATFGWPTLDIPDCDVIDCECAMHSFKDDSFDSFDADAETFGIGPFGATKEADVVEELARIIAEAEDRGAARERARR